MKRRARLLLCLALMACLPALCQGQGPGEVRGVVRDAEGGEPLARVEVELQPGAERRVTDDKGQFAFRGVGPGEYVLRASTVDYRVAKQQFTLAAAEVKEFEIALAPEILRQTIEVKAGPFETAQQDSRSVLSLRGDEAKNLGSVLADDPLRVVQGLPGVKFDAMVPILPSVGMVVEF
jgi:hypothetical protein